VIISYQSRWVELDAEAFQLTGWDSGTEVV